jgi:hypothetical protein
MTITEIERALRDLRLSGIAATLNTRVMQAQSSQQPFLETLASMLQDELDRRHSRLTERRFKHSRLEERLALADFDWRFNPKLPRQACFRSKPARASVASHCASAMSVLRPGTALTWRALTTHATMPTASSAANGLFQYTPVLSITTTSGLISSAHCARRGGRV